jgi:hypothetical protein
MSQIKNAFTYVCNLRNFRPIDFEMDSDETQSCFGEEVAAATDELNDIDSDDTTPNLNFRMQVLQPNSVHTNMKTKASI